MPDDYDTEQPSKPIKFINILGKDYFTQKEAAYYCCISLRQFQNVAIYYGLTGFRFGGKLLYRKVDCQRAIEREWKAHSAPRPTASGQSAETMRRNRKEIWVAGKKVFTRR